MNTIIEGHTVLNLSTQLIQASAIDMHICSESSEGFRGLLDKIKVGRILECYECRITQNPTKPLKTLVHNMSILNFWIQP
jgi:hypothetical protein